MKEQIACHEHLARNCYKPFVFKSEYFLWRGLAPALGLHN